MFMSDGDTEVCQLIVLDTIAGDTVASDWYSSDASDHITIDTTSYMVSINDLYLSNTNGDSTVLISGSLFAEFIEIVAGVPFVLSIPGSDEGEEFVWEFFDDGTGIRILEHWDNFYDYSWLDTLQFDWYANDDSVTIIHIDDWYGEEHLDTLTLAYSVMDDTLYVSESIDPCGEYYYWYDNCDEYYDLMSMLHGTEHIRYLQYILLQPVSFSINIKL